MIIIFILLSFCIILPVWFLSNINQHTIILNIASLTVIILFSTWTLNNFPNYLVNINWYNSNLTCFNFSLTLDFFSITFFTVSLYITWSIIEFAQFYMNTDPNQFRFNSTLILFLLLMLILVSANNLFVLFIGWEGVGILSFILIGWWFTRNDANSSALQAIIYNRIGDTGIIMFIAILAISLSSWNLNNTLNELPQHITNIITAGIIIAATGKSAQFSLHPWLPAAMEGPTPVSALLHSSTMVVAGVFLLIRTNFLINSVYWALPLIGILGSLTSLFAASIAISQNDLKKVIAYSTTSQLGLMIVAISINLPMLAFFHICTHAFFKALLFLCSGNIIHSYNNEQDLRKISSSSITNPYTSSAIVIASIALCGFPFMAGFYSKDLILEFAQISPTNLLTIILSFFATLLTSVYTLRTLFFITYPITNNNSLIPINEENKNTIFALTRLIAGAIISGWLLLNFAFNFIPPLINLTLKNIPIYMFFSALVLTTSQTTINNLILHKFLNSNWYFTNITHTLTPAWIIASSINGTLRILDQGWNLNLSTHNNTLIKNALNVFQHAFNANLTRYILNTLLISIIILATLLNTI